MKNRLNFLLILLSFIIYFVVIKNYIDSIEYKIETQIALKEIEIYQSISNNANLIKNNK